MRVINDYNKAGRTWSEGDVAELKRLYAAKEATSDIANALGRTVRGIQGALVKFGIEYRQQAQIRFERPQAVVKPRYVDSKAPSGYVSLMDAKPNQCRWGYGIDAKDANKGTAHYVCGKKCKEGSSYCDKHHNMAWSPREKPDITGLADKYQ